METEEIVTQTAKVWLDENGILRVTSLPGATQTLAQAHENMSVEVQLSGGKRRPLLVDLRGMKSFDRDARAYYAGQEAAKYQSAIALLIGSPLSRVIGNFFIGFNKPAMPTRLFTSELEALEWLKEFLT